MAYRGNSASQEFAPRCAAKKGVLAYAWDRAAADRTARFESGSQSSGTIPASWLPIPGFEMLPRPAATLFARLLVQLQRALGVDPDGEAG
jgi:hypothetical protein